jgi:CelD/BcsL family acetyltransferase involved in cellulose biosynthesis
MDVSSTYDIQIHTDIETCKTLWKQFSPAETLFDDWDFRAVFHSYYQHELYFIAAYAGDTCVGILPLQKNKTTHIYEAWCGDYMEDNRAMTDAHHTNCIPFLYLAIPRPSHIQYIRGTDVYTTALEIQDYKYILPLTLFGSSETYLEHTHVGKHLKEVRRKLRKTEELAVSIRKNNAADMLLLFEWNRLTFKEHSSFNDRPHHEEIFKDLVSYAGDNLKLITICVDTEPVAVSFAILYKNTYTCLNRGLHPLAPKHIREYIHMQKITDSLLSGATIMDGLVGDYGWKKEWGFQEIPQHVFKKDTE